MNVITSIDASAYDTPPMFSSARDKLEAGMSGASDIAYYLEADLAALPHRESLVVTLHYHYGLSLSEVAGFLDIHPVDACIAKYSALRLMKGRDAPDICS